MLFVASCRTLSPLTLSLIQRYETREHAYSWISGIASTFPVASGTLATRTLGLHGSMHGLQRSGSGARRRMLLRNEAFRAKACWQSMMRFRPRSSNVPHGDTRWSRSTDFFNSLPQRWVLSFFSMLCINHVAGSCLCIDTPTLLHMTNARLSGPPNWSAHADDVLDFLVR